uniref:SBP-type domain-containing protein n=1 Tax=Leersia perrieri TaxID=77586 RepID=A0A0D9WSU1_9ORYZ
MMSGRMNSAGDEYAFAAAAQFVGFDHAAAAQRAGMQHHHHIYDHGLDFATAMHHQFQPDSSAPPQLLPLPPTMSSMAPPPPMLPMPMQIPMPMPMAAPDVYPALGGGGVVKREGGGDAGRIGLNLGRRTYFSPGDMLAVDRLLMRSRLGGVFGLGFGGAHHQPPRCQAEGCKADLSGAKHYHRRHKVCEYHAKASVVAAAGKQQRFCQQCSRFHVLTEFDEAKRSCRKRLAEHNRRRRKPAATALSQATAKDAAASPASAGKKPTGATSSYTGDNKNMGAMSAAKSPISSNTSVISCLAGEQSKQQPPALTLGAAPPSHDTSSHLAGAVLHHHQHHSHQEHLQMSSLVHINGGGSNNNNILSCSSVCSSALPSTATNGEVSDQNNNDNSHNNNGSNNNNMHLFEVDFM